MNIIKQNINSIRAIAKFNKYYNNDIDGDERCRVCYEIRRKKNVNQL